MSLFHKIWRGTIGPYSDKMRDWILIRKVSKRQRLLAKRLPSKQKITVVFFVLYDSMWKSDHLFRLLLDSDKFEPYIISISYLKQDIEQRILNQTKLEAFFKYKGYPYVNGYDYYNNQAFDIQTLDPDIVFYQQPYNDSEREFQIQSLYKRALLCYIPYGFVIENSGFFYDSFLQNTAWKVFYPTKFQLEDAIKHARNKGDNVIISGYPIEDDIIPGVRSDDCGCWKQADKSIKRIIWAPHHSIMNNDMLNYSTFLEIADDMVALAKKYDGIIQFAFKPHPVLKEKLYNIPEWGKNKTDNYYHMWASMPNCCLAEDDFISLFNSSDAMIHDCSSFSVEYLYTLKPVMYLAKNSHHEYLNSFGKICYDLHYTGNNLSDVESFIEDVVLDGNDSMYSSRSKFVKDNLISHAGKTVAETIFSELLKC